jgi:hypothetical protein
MSKSIRFAPRVPVIVTPPSGVSYVEASPSEYVLAEGLTPVYGSSSAYTYEAPFATFVRTPLASGFLFSFKHLPYEQLSSLHQDYYDWLLAVCQGLSSLLPDKFKHAPNPETDTVATLEAFTLSSLSRIPATDADSVRKVSTADVWQAGGQFISLMNADLRPYIFRTFGLWPAAGKLPYRTVLSDEDRLAVSALDSLRKAIVDRALAELSQAITLAAVATDDQLVPAVQDALAMALFSKLQFKHQVSTNVVASSLAKYTDTLSRWRRRFQLLTPELLAYLQRQRYGDASKTFMPLSVTPSQPPPSSTNYVWLPSGELDYNPWIRSSGRRPAVLARNQWPRFVAVPAGPPADANTVTALPRGTVVQPPESLVSLRPVSGVFTPTYHSSSGSTTTGRPIASYRPAFVDQGQAQLLGGSHDARRPHSAAGAAAEPIGYSYMPAEQTRSAWIAAPNPVVTGQSFGTDLSGPTWRRPRLVGSDHDHSAAGTAEENGTSQAFRGGYPPAQAARSVGWTADAHPVVKGRTSASGGAIPASSHWRPNRDDWQEPRLFGYDPDNPHQPKKTGGCAP